MTIAPAFRNPKLIEAIQRTYPHFGQPGLAKIDGETYRLARQTALNYLRELVDENDPDAAELLVRGKQLNDKQVALLERTDCATGSAADQIRETVLDTIAQQFKLDISKLHPSDVSLK